MRTRQQPLRSMQDTAPAIHLVTPQDLLRAIEADVARCQTTIYVPLYAASFHSAHVDPAYRTMLSQTCNYPDGAGVVWALRRRGIRAMRTATTDVGHDVFAMASARGWKVFLYGGEPAVVEKVVQVINRDYPGVGVVGARDGYSDVDPADVARLRPNLTLVARGAGVQERWALSARESLAAAGAGPILTCGGLFDFLAGEKRRAPMWMQKYGLEWIFRTMLEPRRLMRRYVMGNTWFTMRYLLGDSAIPVAPPSLREARTLGNGMGDGGASSSAGQWAR
jgi:N-acetylglucosaminyldiphosphoundecaprenol N-acetyl-beta-D-mannosaminyltransferase